MGHHFTRILINLLCNHVSFYACFPSVYILISLEAAFPIAPMASVPSWGLLEQPVPEPHTKTQLEKAAEDAVPTASSSTMISEYEGVHSRRWRY